MRLRRLEIFIIGITLAFACFMGGFFTGRNWSAVNIVAVATQNNESQNDDSQNTENLIRQQESLSQDDPVNLETPTTEITQTQQENTFTGQPQEEIGVPGDGDGKININLATQSELMDLPGIGNVLASRIVDYRRQHGDFSRIEELRNVSGIGEKRYETVKDLITTG